MPLVISSSPSSRKRKRSHHERDDLTSKNHHETGIAEERIEPQNSEQLSALNSDHPSVEQEDLEHHNVGDFELDEEKLMEAGVEPPRKKRANEEKLRTGRPPLPDIPCEHGPSSKSCHKCKYQKRVQKAGIKHDQTFSVIKNLHIWVQNLVFLSSLSEYLVCPISPKDSDFLIDRYHLIDHRIELYSQYNNSNKLDNLKLKPEQLTECVERVFSSLRVSSPISIETAFFAAWILQRPNIALQDFIGETAYELTVMIAQLYHPNLNCAGITDNQLVEHFKYWKGSVWELGAPDGILAYLVNGDTHTVRSIHCNGFLHSYESEQLICPFCLQVQQKLIKERLAYKQSQPGLKTLLKILPPGFKNIVQMLKEKGASYTEEAEREIGDYFEEMTNHHHDFESNSNHGDTNDHINNADAQMLIHGEEQISTDNNEDQNGNGSKEVVGQMEVLI